MFISLISIAINIAINITYLTYANILNFCFLIEQRYGREWVHKGCEQVLIILNDIQVGWIA